MQVLIDFVRDVEIVLSRTDIYVNIYKIGCDGDMIKFKVKRNKLSRQDLADPFKNMSY